LPPTRLSASPGRRTLWIVFAIYLAISGFTMTHHELSGDEVHSWNIAKGSATLPELVRNSRYEGHPPGWYVLLWPLSRVTHAAASIQLLHWAIASCVAFVVLFRSPLPTWARLLVPFGYYFLFEYAILSRNYAIGVLLGCLLCVLLGSKDRERTFLYYLFLFLMSNTHLLAAVLAGCLHLAVLFRMRQRGGTAGSVAGHVVLGLLALLPSAYFIFPPGDSALNVESWRARWTPEQVRAFAQAPLRSFVPVPAWWTHGFWNTQVLLEARTRFSFLRLVNPLIALLVLSGATWTLWRHTASLLLFTANLGLSFVIAATVLPMTAARYSGFLYVAFVLALWLACAEGLLLNRAKAMFLRALFALQVVGGLFAAWSDVRLPFANLFRIVELAAEVPPDSRLVSDYWTMNAYSAFIDKPIYCVDMRRELSFVLWDGELREALKNASLYSDGFREIFRHGDPKAVHLVSDRSPSKLFRADHDLEAAFRVDLVDRREGAIDPGGNLYLYRVAPH
jgi:hypothetical protein